MEHLECKQFPPEFLILKRTQWLHKISLHATSTILIQGCLIVTTDDNHKWY